MKVLGRRGELRRLDLLEPVAGDVIDELADALGGVDVLVNNAGMGHSAPFLEHELRTSGGYRS